MKLQTAQRSQVKLRLGLSGASGFGKTYSALLLAHGITNDWTKIAIIDTENNSASLYSDLGNYNVISFSEPYNPERYIKAIKTCEDAQIEVIIIDSITHEWQGTGGCLHIHEQLGGRFQDWAKVSPRHQAFIDAILQSKAHVITTVRSKIDYSMDSSSNGKTKVVKHGLKSITREGYEYELTSNFELINENHMVKASKDRTGLFMNKPEFIINSSTGRKLIQWCNQGLSVDQARKEIEVCTTLEGLRHLYQKYIGLREQVHPLILERKAVLESITSQVVPNKEIINPLKTKKHGANS